MASQVAYELEFLRKEKARLVRESVKLRSRLDDAKSEISALKREIKQIKSERQRELEAAKSAGIKQLIDELS